MHASPQTFGFLRYVRGRIRVISALMLRELHARFGRENLGYVWLFVEPALLGVGVALWQFVAKGDNTMPGDLNKFGFFLIGYILFFLFRTLVSRSTTGVEANAQLFYHATVTIESVMLARSLLDTGAVMVCMSFFLILIGLLYGQWPDDPLQMAIGVIFMLGVAHGFSLLFLAATAWGPQLIEKVVHPFSYLTIPFSGMFFMVWWMPGPYQQIVLWIPLIHIMEFVREGQFGPGVPYHYDIGYMLGWAFGLNFLGLCALNAAKPHLEM